MKKRILSILLTLALLISLFPAALAEDIVIVDPEALEGIRIVDTEDPGSADNPGTAADAEPVYRPAGDMRHQWTDEPNWSLNGKCGDNLSWVFDNDARSLTISGSGAMWDFIDNAPGWYNQRSSIQSIVIKSGVTSIGADAFVDSRFLTNVSIPDSVTSIGAWAFAECASLMSITLPRKLAEIGGGVFASDTALSEIKLASGNTTFKSVDGVLYSADGTVLVAYPCGRSGDYALEQGTLAVYFEAFTGCTGLTALSACEDLALIDDGAFYGCANLIAIDGCGRLLQIGVGAFYNCAKLDFYIPECVKYIGAYAFYNCRMLPRLYIPAGQTEIGDYTFYFCDSATGGQIPLTVQRIGEAAFQYCKGFTELMIPENVTEIGSSAFSGCSNVKKAIVPASVTSVGQYAFQCGKLKTAGPIGSGCNMEFGWQDKIPNNAFSGMTNLKSVILPEGLTSIGARAFKVCRALEKLELPGSVSSIGKEAFLECRVMKTVSLCESLQTIGENAFQQCYYLESLEFPASLKTIGANAFSNCNKLNSLFFDGPAPSFGEGCFRSVKATAYYPADDESWTEAVRQNYGGTITWAPTVLEPGPAASVEGLSTAGVVLAWDTQEGAESYKLQCSVNGGAWTALATVADTAYTDASARMGKTYRYRVRAVIGGSFTDWSVPVEVFFNPFTDVSGTKTIEYVAWAFNNGIVNGTSTTTFAPDAPCTRIQFVMMLWKMHGSPVVGGTNPFSDISGKKTTNAILWALKAGVINPAGKFFPDDNISRIQIVMMLWKLAGSPNATGENPFTDVSGSKTTKAVLWAYQNGITKGTSSTTFAPDKDCTRVQLVIFLYKYNNIYHVI